MSIIRGAPACLVLIATGLMAAPFSVNAQYNVTTLFLQGSPIPGFPAVSWKVNVGTIPSMPLSISGNYVAFVQCSCDGTTEPTDGVWVLNTSTNTFTHLVAPGQIPRGPNETALTSFGGYALVAGGRVVFLGYTAGGDGFYSVPAGGGSISVIADQNTMLPGVNLPGTFSFGNSTVDFPQSDGTTFAFSASTSAGDVTLTSTLTGSNLQELAGPNTSLPPDGVCDVTNTGSGAAQPRVHGANSIFDTPSFFNNYLYIAGPVGTPPPLCILDSSVPLSGDLQFDYVSYTAIDSQGIYFTAVNGSNGIFEESFDGAAPTTILSPTQTLPGIPPPFASINGIGAENGTVIFNTTGFSGDGNSVSALYAAKNGAITRIAGTGDILGGQVGNAWLPPIAPNSISNGKVVFTFGESAVGIFLASPAICAADVTSQLRITQSPPVFHAATGDYSSTVTIQNTGSGTIAAPVSAVFDGLVASVLTYGTQPPELLNSGVGATTCLAPLGEAYLTLNGGKALTPGEKVSLQLGIADPANVPVSFTTRVVTGTTR